MSRESYSPSQRTICRWSCFFPPSKTTLTLKSLTDRMRQALSLFYVAENGKLSSQVILRSVTGDEFGVVSVGRYPRMF